MAIPTTHSDPVRPVLYPGAELRWPASILWRAGEPAIRKITTADVLSALLRGIDDFRAMPTHVFFACIIYPVVGIILFRLLFGFELLPLIYPMAAGFALLGLFVAIGLYELSRRREQGLDISPARALDVLNRPAIGAIWRLGLVLAAIFVAWIYAANLIHTQLFGSDARSPAEYFDQLTTTDEGTQLVVGNVIGFLFAAFVLVISVVSFPMLVDRDVSAATAVRTSVRAAIENPIPVALWGLIVALGLLLGALPALIGLAIVLPVLGHATWHLYRKLVAPE